MNKIFKALTNFFKIIYAVIDRIIVTPISKLIYIINEKLKNNSGRAEKLLNKPYMLVYLSLAFAVGIFFLVDSRVLNLVQTEAEILTDQPVNVKYNKEAYVVEGLPDSVDITLIGRKSDLYLAKQLGDHEVLLDLTEYEEGSHKVKLTLNKTIESLSYKLDPGTIPITIKKRESRTKTITSDLLNQEKLDAKLSVKNVTLSTTDVVVKGSADTLDRIASIKALVDLANEQFTVKGKYNIDNVPLVAYDEYGNVIQNVEIIKSTVTASVELTSFSKEVPIKVLTVGELKAGRAINSMKINNKEVLTVTIYGDEEVLSGIEIIPVTIDITGQGNAAKTYNEALSKPSGVRYISEKSVQIVLEFGEESQKTINDVQVKFRNIAANLKVNAITSADSKVNVQLKGVLGIISKIDDTGMEAYVDLSNYTVGTHEVPVLINGDDPRVSYLATKTVRIEISAAK